MKKWNSVLSSIVIMMVLAFTLAGCGKDKETDKVEAEEIVEEVTEPAEVETEEVVVEEIAEEEEEVEEPVDTRTPVQKFWGGDWYGIMWFTGATGQYKEYDNQYWDAMGTIDVDESGNADMLLWYEAVDRDNPVANVQLTISEASGSGEMGAAFSESGWMFVNSDTGNGDVKHADWIIDPMTDPISSKYGNDMIHIEGDYLDGTGEIYYHFFLRKWGTLWDDVVSDPEMLAPGYYEDWYKPLIAEGYAMPKNIGDDGTVKMGDEATQAVAKNDSTDDSGDSKAEDNKPASSASTYDGGELVLIDDEYCKVVINGTGCNPYNDSWIGYMVELTNKSDFSIYFSSYAEPNLNEQTVKSLGTGDTCYYNGEVCKTHFGNTIKAGMSMDNACLAIDGVTDVSQLGNVQGYISVVNNDTGEVLNNVPYSF